MKTNSISARSNIEIHAAAPRRAFLKNCALAGTGLAPALRGNAAEPTMPAATDIWEIFRARRSVRKFKSDPVPEADIRKILDAARLAATSGNQQPWKFLVIRDPAKIEAMRAATVERSLNQASGTIDEKKKQMVEQRVSGYFSAPVYIVVLTDNQSQYVAYNHWDGPLAAGNLMLAARALGYGTVFISDSIVDEITKSVLKIPDRYTRVCITPIGVPVAWPPPPAKKPLDAFIAWETLTTDASS
ncbi:MAG: nitroreductase family protein [Nibricoccus sp.]